MSLPSSYIREQVSVGGKKYIRSLTTKPWWLYGRTAEWFAGSCTTAGAACKNSWAIRLSSSSDCSSMSGSCVLSPSLASNSMPFEPVRERVSNGGVSTGDDWGDDEIVNGWGDGGIGDSWGDGMITDRWEDKCAGGGDSENNWARGP